MENTIIQPRVERARTKLVVPHGGKEIAFAYPSIGPGSYFDVGRNILKSGQNVPTGDYASSLIHVAYCHSSVKDETEFQDVRNMMKKRWLWVFNRNLWTPEGVYVVQDLEAIGRSQLLNQNDLEKALKGGKEIKGIRFSKDKRTRFASKESYDLGEHTSESLARNGFLIASYDFEGAEKLGEVSEKFANNPFVYGVVDATNPEQWLSALGSVWYLGDRLHVYGNFRGDDYDGHAFGVCSPEKSK